MNILLTNGQDAPGYEPELGWRFGDYSFMRQLLNTQALLFRSPILKSTLGLALLQNIITPTLLQLESCNFGTILTSHLTCHMSNITFFFLLFFLLKKSCS